LARFPARPRAGPASATLDGDPISPVAAAVTAVPCCLRAVCNPYGSGRGVWLRPQSCGLLGGLDWRQLRGMRFASTPAVNRRPIPSSCPLGRWGVLAVFPESSTQDLGAEASGKAAGLRSTPPAARRQAQAGKGLTPRNHRSATVQALRQGHRAVVWGIFRLRRRVRAFTHSSAPRRCFPSAFRPGRAHARPSTLSRPACQATNDANPAGNWTGFSLPHLC